MHCAQAFKRARAVLFLIRRSFVTLTLEIFIPLYSALVRPHLEYATQASNPSLKKDIDRLKRLQQLASRTVKRCRGQCFELHVRY